MIHVVAIITAKSGMRDAILKEFHDNMPAVHAEKGCIEYGPAVDAEGIGSFQAPQSGPFEIAWFASLFGAPNNWRLDVAVTDVKYVNNDPQQGSLITIENLDNMAMPVTLEINLLAIRLGKVRHNALSLRLSRQPLTTSAPVASM